MATSGDGTPVHRRSNNGAGTQKQAKLRHDQFDARDFYQCP
jgi:hypothetical protein